jgi:hypothetical protein
LARTESQGKRAGSWNISETVRPPMSSVPPLIRSRPATSESSVLLPQPDAPSRQTNSPCATVSETPSRASSALLPVPYVLETFSKRTTASVVRTSLCSRRLMG